MNTGYIGNPTLTGDWREVPRISILNKGCG